MRGFVAVTLRGQCYVSVAVPSLGRGFGWASVREWVPAVQEWQETGACNLRGQAYRPLRSHLAVQREGAGIGRQDAGGMYVGCMWDVCGMYAGCRREFDAWGQRESRARLEFLVAVGIDGRGRNVGWPSASMGRAGGGPSKICGKLGGAMWDKAPGLLV